MASYQPHPSQQPYPQTQPGQPGYGQPGQQQYPSPYYAGQPAQPVAQAPYIPQPYIPPQQGAPVAAGNYTYGAAPAPAGGPFVQLQGGYAPQQGTYPQQQGTYPQQQVAYPQQQGAYPQQQGAYPQQQGSYPQQAQYGAPPMEQQFATPQQHGQAAFPFATHVAVSAVALATGLPLPSFPQFTGPQLPGFYTSTTPLLTPQEIARDVETLHKAMKGFGTNEKKLIEVLGSRTPDQTGQLALAYHQAHGKSLVAVLESETSGKFQALLRALVMPMPEYDARCLKEATKGIGTDEDMLIEILVGRSNADIWAIKQCYNMIYRKDLETDIADDLSGDLKRLFLALLKGQRCEIPGITVEGDAEALYRAGEGRLGTNESKFFEIFTTRTERHLQMVFQAYQSKRGSSIENAVKKEFSGTLERALIALVRSIQDRPAVIADMFESSMKGMGTNDDKLIRLTARHRDPGVMTLVKNAYAAKYGKSLHKRIEGETSGDYEKLLLACVK